jgi:hypothetical protein
MAVFWTMLPESVRSNGNGEIESSVSIVKSSTFI